MVRSRGPWAALLAAATFAGCDRQASSRPATPEEPVKPESSTAPSSSEKTSSPETTAAKRYTCEHHPEIVRDAPGVCPTCGMELKPGAS